MGVQIQINQQQILDRIQQGVQESQLALDTQVLKDSNSFIPQDTLNARDSGVQRTIPGAGKVTWDTPYIRRIYYGTEMNFSKDKNPNATSLWFEHAKSRFLSDWVQIAQDNFNI